MIDLYSVVAFFHKAKWTELAITHEINHLLGKYTIGDLMVRKYVRMFALSTKETYIPVIPESEGGFSLDDRIVLVLSEEPFLSVRQIAKKVTMSKSTLYSHLTQTRRWKLWPLKLVSHSLTESEN
jgi:hypothetical protein